MKFQEKMVDKLAKEYEKTLESLNAVSKDTIKRKVQQLLKEIELTDLEWVVHEDGTQKRMDEKERKQILKNLIKKAFEGVLRE